MAKAGRKSGEKQRASPPRRRRQKQGEPPRPAQRTPEQPRPAPPKADSQSAFAAPAAVVPGAPAGPANGLRAIEPPAAGARWHLDEIRRHRAAFVYFLRRYLRKRYGRTFLGYIWLFLPTLLPLFMGALVFGGILGVSVPGVPYFLYFAVALSTWLLFSQTAYLATRSLEIARSDIRRVYTPRLIPLMAAMTLPMFTYLIYVAIISCSLCVYVLVRGEFYLALGPETLLVPLALVMLVVFGWACGLWFSPLAPRARDVRRLAGYVIGFWYFLTPVMYPISEIPEQFQFLASLNPITAPVQLVTDGLLGVGGATALGLVTYFVALVLVGGFGLRIFLAKERRDMAFY
jgi:lipopolysaccharide transport system permease protein